jgi:hypothetical protein
MLQTYFSPNKKKSFKRESRICSPKKRSKESLNHEYIFLGREIQKKIWSVSMREPLSAFGNFWSLHGHQSALPAVEKKIPKETAISKTLS